MLATLVIGLREGLEAALIVSIIAAFLRRHGKTLRPMWIGVVLAIVLSIVVGVALGLIEQALPQSKQEALETVIGLVAVFFVTGMIAWMNTHSRDLKGQLEAEAAAALGSSSVYALSLMAFLAVLKEGFETAVFLLATLSAAQSTLLAGLGAIVGLVLAAVIGWGIYKGGVKINLSRFFRFTGAFLILVAAGLTITVLRTAHEAGWLNAGQEMTVNLSWLVAPGTVQSALITGVLGIPADPRLIEVLGWFAYLVPVSLYIFWPQAKRPGPRGAARLKIGIAVALLLAAGVLAFAWPTPELAVPDSARIAEGGQNAGTATLHLADDGKSATLSVVSNGVSRSIDLPQSARSSTLHNGFPVTVWTRDDTASPTNLPKQLTVDQVIELSGGRVPVGLSPSSYPGPYDTDWKVRRTVTVWSADGALLDASEDVSTLVTLTGGGLGTPRTLRVRSIPDNIDLPAGWQVASDYSEQAYAQLGHHDAALTERFLWAVELPLVLSAIAVILLLLAARQLRPPFRSGTPEPSSQIP